MNAAGQTAPRRQFAQATDDLQPITASPEMSEIEGAINDLRDTIGTVLENQEYLRQRLASVLKPAGPEDIDKQNTSASCEVASNLVQMRAQACRVLAITNDITNRLCL